MSTSATVASAAAVAATTKMSATDCPADLAPIIAWAKENPWSKEKMSGGGAGETGKQPKDLERAEGNKWRKRWKNDGVDTSQWTTIVGEGLVKETLEARGYKAWKPKTLDGYEPDWETDDFMVEVKSRTWNTTGTAGEKVLGTPYKYASIPRIYKKPLIIVLVAYQERELRQGKTSIIGEGVNDEQRQILECYKGLGITYQGLTDWFRELGW